MLEVLPGKALAGTISLLPLHILVANHTARGNPVAPLQALHKPRRGLELFLGNIFTVKISHEADADSEFVHVHCVAMGPVHLFVPPVTGFHLTRLRPAGPVIDYEMITQSVPEAATAVAFVKNFCVADFGGAVVNDDILPTFGIGKIRQDPHRFAASGNKDARADLKVRNIADLIQVHDLSDVNAIHLAETPQRFAPLQRVINANRIPGGMRTDLCSRNSGRTRGASCDNDNKTKKWQ